MQTITIEEAARDLQGLVRHAREGEEIILTDAGDPVARITAIRPPAGKREPGSARDIILFMADDFDAPLDDFHEYQE